jgi:DNA-binding transcriptional regulator LsrR (DeoR family)
MLHVAREYYLRDRTRVEIAAATGLSRWQVSRLLVEARNSGRVTVKIGPPATQNEDLAESVKAALGLRQVVVVGRMHGKQEIKSSVTSIAHALAALLPDVVRSGNVLGFTWSRVNAAMPQYLESLPPCDVVQLAGAITPLGERIGSVEIIRQVAQVADGVAYPLYVPLIMDDASTAEALARQPEIAACLQMVERLDIAVVAIGAWTPEGSLLYPQVSEELASAVSATGAVGEISGRFFDHAGNAVHTDLDGRILGITIDELRRVPLILATSYGAHRAHATIAAARARLIHSLIVDEAQATEILAQVR